LHGLQIDLERMIAVESADQQHFIAEAQSVDSRLHDLIAGRCGNAFLAHELGRLKMLFRAFRDAAWDRSQSRNEYHRLASESHEHMAIVQGLLRGDRPGAVRAMAKHIASGMKYWCRAIPSHSSNQAQDRLMSQNGYEGELS
jgi:DNA-binding GntR family transcriptional regulator